MKRYLFTLTALFLFTGIYGQIDTTPAVSLTSLPDPNAPVVHPEKNNDEPVYKLKPAIDIPLTAATAGWSLYGFSQIYSKDKSSEETIRNLRKSDINGFDRWGADVYHEKAEKVSDYFFYGAMPFPVVLMADKKIRKDAAKITFLYLETMSITGLFYTGSAYLFDRYRPLAYNSNAPMGERTGGGAKNSFFAGHGALVATSTFFTAKVYNDYHPESKFKWVLWGTAAVASGTTMYLRHRAGKHFPSDIIVGLAIGTSTGILVPHFHKNKFFKNDNMSLRPFTTGQSHGLSFRYKFE